jgi:hypothetical protein
MEQDHERAVFTQSLSQSQPKKNYVAPTGPQNLSVRETEKLTGGLDFVFSSGLTS